MVSVAWPLRTKARPSTRLGSTQLSMNGKKPAPHCRAPTLLLQAIHPSLSMLASGQSPDVARRRCGTQHGDDDDDDDGSNSSNNCFF